LKILLLGNNGQLGWELNRTLQSLGEMVALNYPEVDLANPKSIRETLKQYQPQIIYNATAYTAVDKAESEPKLAQAINGIGPGVLAEEADRIHAVLIHFSTDYVFDGKKGEPYTEIDMPNPQNVYGASKLAGEQAIQSVGGAYLILRTAWVFSMRCDNFVTRVLRWARQNETLRIVNDQISNPTWARMLAEATSQLHARGGDYFLPWIAEHKGIYHLAGNGFASRYSWAEQILASDPNGHEQVTKKLLPAASSEFPAAANRPLFSAMDCAKFISTFGLQLPGWKQALALAMQENLKV
jgi:dTDP-4-dehydrorhamnose reductase